ncbi:MAG: hypothetical protein IT381_15745 [Deltaproteobacteria bacterium]|nr:hypothetical protein [Deltaproteobacteria bacterium]
MMLWLAVCLLAQDAETAPASQPASAAASAEVEVPAVELAEDKPAAAPAEVATAAPASAETTTPATPATPPAGRTAVSAAVNADQAALSGKLQKAWSVMLTLSTSVGIGTFLQSQTPSAAYAGSTLTVEPGYVLSLPADYRVRLSARESFTVEYTPADNPTGRQVDYSDLLLGASARLYKIPTIDVDMWGSFRLPLPISLDSVQATLVTALIPGLGLSKSFEWGVSAAWRMSLNIRYDFVFRKNFHRFNMPIQRASADPYAPTVYTRTTDTLVDGGVGRGGSNTDFSISNALTVSFSPWDIVSLSFFIGIGNTFRYPITSTRDFYTPEDAVVGAGRSDTVRSNIDVTITLLPQLLISAGVFTAAPPFAPDNRTLYAPFIIPQSAANNYTQLYVSLTSVL